jgi:hypothetical protein
MLAVVVEEPLLWPAPGELVRKATESLMRRTRHEDPAAVVALA